MIPPEKTDAVARGLREAFGVTAFDDISRMTGGHTSSLVFRIILGGSPYVLKVITRTEDPTRHYTSMKAAADAGVAPRVWHTSAEDRIAITDFVDAKPLPGSEALVRLPAVLRTLHALAPFARAPFNTTCTFLLNKGPALDGFLQQVRAANILPAAESEELFARYAEVAAVYPHDETEMVSSHNDLFKPDNILFDGRRVWLVDWEAAFLNDRYADLAVVANLVVTNDDEEAAYLQAYFGGAIDRYQRARFHLMQQLAHVFYAMVFLLLGSAGSAGSAGPAGPAGKPIDWTTPVPDFADYHRRMWAGDVDLADKDVKVVYGRVHYERLLRNVQQPRYRDALKTVSDRHAAS